MIWIENLCNATMAYSADAGHIIENLKSINSFSFDKV